MAFCLNTSRIDGPSGSIRHLLGCPLGFVHELDIHGAHILEARSDLFLDAFGKPIKPGRTPRIGHDQIDVDVVALHDNLLDDADIDKIQLSLTPWRSQQIELELVRPAQSIHHAFMADGSRLRCHLSLGNGVQQTLLVADKIAEPHMITAIDEAIVEFQLNISSSDRDLLNYTQSLVDALDAAASATATEEEFGTTESG